jgi:Cys-Gly metallodipeptidase DUG1
VSKLVNERGDILIPGIKELVAPLTDEERSRYEAIHVEVKDFEDAVGAKITIHDDKVNTVSDKQYLSSNEVPNLFLKLMGRMRYPSLSLHGIEGAFCEFNQSHINFNATDLLP